MFDNLNCDIRAADWIESALEVVVCMVRQFEPHPTCKYRYANFRLCHRHYRDKDRRQQQQMI